MQSAAFARCHNLTTSPCSKARASCCSPFDVQPLARVLAHASLPEAAQACLITFGMTRLRARVFEHFCARGGARPYSPIDSRFRTPLSSRFKARVGSAFANIFRCARPHALHAGLTFPLPAPHNNHCSSRLTTVEAKRRCLAVGPLPLLIFRPGEASFYRATVIVSHDSHPRRTAGACCVCLLPRSRVWDSFELHYPWSGGDRLRARLATFTLVRRRSSDAHLDHLSALGARARSSRVGRRIVSVLRALALASQEIRDRLLGDPVRSRCWRVLLRPCGLIHSPVSERHMMRSAF